LWSIQDHISALGDSSSSPRASGSKQSVKTTNEKENPKVDPRGIFHGHDNTVEDVEFCPSR
jgi:histone-binding protein RBBP4